MRKPCKDPCPECPYKKDSTPGYFGGHKASDYLNFISRDSIVACHMRNEYDEDELATGEIRPCTGHALAQMNSFKSPMPGSPLAEVHAELKDEPRDNILSVFNFGDHHNC